MSKNESPIEKAKSNKCGFISDWLYAFAEGDTPHTLEFSRMEEHISSCPRCSDRLKRARKFQSSVSSLLGTLKPKRNLRDAVLGELDVSIEKMGISTQKGMIIFLSILFVGLLSVFLLRPSLPPPVASVNEFGVVKTWQNNTWTKTSKRTIQTGEQVIAGSTNKAELNGKYWTASLSDNLGLQVFQSNNGLQFNIISSGQLELAHKNKSSLKITVKLGKTKIVSQNAIYILSVKGDASATIEVKRGQVIVGSHKLSHKDGEYLITQPAQ